MQPELRHEAESAYAARLGMTEQAFLEHVGVTLTPAQVGQSVVALLTDNAYQAGIAFGLTAGQGLESLH